MVYEYGAKINDPDLIIPISIWSLEKGRLESETIIAS